MALIGIDSDMHALELVQEQIKLQQFRQIAAATAPQGSTRAKHSAPSIHIAQTVPRFHLLCIKLFTLLSTVWIEAGLHSCYGTRPDE